MDRLVGTVQGVLPSMKNGRRIVRNRGTGHPLSIKSQVAIDFETIFNLQVKRPAKAILDEVILTLDIYYPNQRHDVDGELFCDLLQKRGVLNNDRQIRRKIFTKYLDKLNPRVEWKLEEFNEN